jgi:hypothetical protein
MRCRVATRSQANNRTSLPFWRCYTQNLAVRLSGSGRRVWRGSARQRVGLDEGLAFGPVVAGRRPETFLRRHLGPLGSGTGIHPVNPPVTNATVVTVASLRSLVATPRPIRRAIVYFAVYGQPRTNTHPEKLLCVDDEDVP